jgi:hypothetical protein
MYIGFNPRPGDRNLRARLMIHEFRYVAALGGPDFFGFSEITHDPDNTLIGASWNIPIVVGCRAPNDAADAVLFVPTNKTVP